MSVKSDAIIVRCCTSSNYNSNTQQCALEIISFFRLPTESLDLVKARIVTRKATWFVLFQMHSHNHYLQPYFHFYLQKTMIPYITNNPLHYSAKSMNAVFTAPSPFTSFPCFKIRTRLISFPSMIRFHNPFSSASSKSRGTIPISTKSDRITSHISPSSFRTNTKSPCFTEISSPFPTLRSFSHSYFAQNRVSRIEQDSSPTAARSESRNNFV